MLNNLFIIHFFNFSSTGFKCDHCPSVFQYIFQVLMHERIEHENLCHSPDQANLQQFNCLFICKQKFSSVNQLLAHMRKCVRPMPKHKQCSMCRTVLKTRKTYTLHTVRCLSQKAEQYGGYLPRLPKLPENSRFKLTRKAFRSYLQQYELFPETSYNNVALFFTDNRHDIENLLQIVLTTLRIFKIQFCLACTFSREVEGTITYCLAYFITRNIIITQATEFDEIFQDIINFLDERVHSFEGLGSGYILNDIDRLDIKLGYFNPITGGCSIELPKQLANKKAIINIKSTDEKCFLWACCAALFPVKWNAERAQNYFKYEKHFNLTGINFPMALSSVEKFEKQNSDLDICINIFNYDANDTKISLIKPMKISNNFNAKNIINLLLYKDHYLYIKNFNRLAGNFTTRKRYYCFACFSGFRNRDKLSKHKNLCQIFKPSIVILPNKNENILKYNQIYKQVESKYVLYADFECKLKPINKRKTPKLLEYQRHIPISYCLIVIENNEKIYQIDLYRGMNVMQKFFRKLKSTEIELLEKLHNIEPLQMTEMDQINFNKAINCHICNQDLGLNKVRDHCHLTGKYVGAAHQNCNLQFKTTYSIPLLIHNLKNYDSHFIIRNVPKYFKNCQIIPRNSEQYLAFKIDRVQFLDSFTFIEESLAKMCENLKEANFPFPLTSKLFNKFINGDNYKRNLLLRKGVFPYEFITSLKKFELKNLPPKDSFYSTLYNKHITDEDYEHAKAVWTEFNCENLGQYHDLYLALDTVLLADCFTNFRQIIHQNYGLETCQFYSIASLSWSACQKTTKFELELLTDIEKYNYIESAIRGGLSVVSKRYSKSNNKYLKNYNPNDESVYLSYLDANNLYGYAMDSKLPISDFKWCSADEIHSIDWYSIDTDQDFGYILEVDLLYPDKLHDYHNDFPLAPCKRKISNEDLGMYQKQLLEQMKFLGYKRIPVEKLLTTLESKSNYIVHFKNLKLYLQLGLELINVHRALKFKQSNYLKDYINLNTEFRKNAKNTFESNLFKKMVNVIFGKSLQDQRGQMEIRLCLTERQIEKYFIKPNFTEFLILDEHKVLLNLRKQIVLLNRPIYLGFTCLEFAKHLMYDIYYNTFKNVYRDRIHLCYTDTDSMLLEVRTQDFYEDLKNKFSDLMDFSNFDGKHFLFDKRNAKVVGKMKDEFPKNVIIEFVGLKSKLYSILYDEDKWQNKAKGIKKSVVKRDICHKFYRDCLLNKTIFEATMNKIQSKNHLLSTIQQTKTALQPIDDKRWLCEDGINSLAFGHYLLRNQLD